MNPFAQKFVPIAKALARKWGELTLFALFKREDSIGNWDVVVAAPWIEKEPNRGIGKIADEIAERLPVPDRENLSAVFTVEPDGEKVAEVHRAVAGKKGIVEFYNRPFFDMDMREAWILVSNEYREPNSRRGSGRSTRKGSTANTGGSPRRKVAKRRKTA